MFSRLSATLFGEELPPPVIGRFSIVRRLGRGGMGTVYEAEDPTLGRRVAVKILHHRATRGHQARLHREARALAMLSHPNVVHVYEVGMHRGTLFIAMELVQGLTLARWREAQPRDWRACVRAYAQAGRALAVAHRAGLVHRDFKPSNAIIDADGRVRVLDFGLARSHERSVTNASATGDDAYATEPGAGTPAFMSPEQIQCGVVGPPSDQFSFCVSLFQALTGRMPFTTQPVARRLEQVAAGRLGPMNPIPRWLQRLLRRGLSFDPAHRFVSMEALLERLERPARLAHPARRWGSTAGAAALFGTLAVVGLRTHGDGFCDDPPWRAEPWSPSIGRDIRRGFLATGHLHAASIAGAVTTSLEAKVAGWGEAQRSVCASGPTALFYDRIACLEAQRTELDTLTTLLTAPDKDTVSYGREMVSLLDSPDRCLGPRPSPHKPPPVEIAADVMQQTTTLLRARLQRSIGHYDKARELLRAAESVANTLRYDPLRAQVLLERGRIEERTGARLKAEAHFEQAVQLALSSDAVELELEARLEWARLLIQPLEDFDRAEDRLNDVRTRAASLPPDPRREADLLALEGFLSLSRGDGEQAQARLTLALKRLERDGEGNELRIARAELLLGSVASLQSQPALAIAHYERAIALRSGVLGPDHPLVGELYFNVGVVQNEQNKPAQAERALNRALEILAPNSSHGDYANTVAGAEIELSGLLTARGELARAETLATSADARLARDLPTTHSQRVAARMARCNVHIEANDLERLLECHRDLLGLHTAGAKNVEPIPLTINIGFTLAELGWLGEAQAHYKRELPGLREALRGENDLLLGVVLDDYASVLERDGAIEDAVARYRDARELLRPLTSAPVDPDSRELLRSTSAHVALALARLDPDADRVELAHETLDVYRDRDDPEAKAARDEINSWLNPP